MSSYEIIGGADGPTSLFLASPWGGFGFNRFGWFEVMFMVVFGLIVITFVVMLIRGVGAWHRNNQSPRLTVEAVVVTKREDMRTRHHDGHHHHYMDYYVTFQVESGDRMELEVPDREYGLLVEGDRGRLTFQGTRYLGFERM